MLLCDIGNTSYHFCKDGNDYKQDVIEFNPENITEKVYFISVNQSIKEKLSGLSNWIDLERFIDKKHYYETMGIDRIVACETLDNAIIVDAGSAVTIDIVKNSCFEGGFIYPGIRAMQQCYENISPALAYSFNFDLSLDIMPKNSKDAISYGYLKTLYREVISHKLPIILTGGDALAFAKIFKNAKIDKSVIFKGMKRL